MLLQVGPGDGVGELALYVSGRARGASVVALERAEVYVLSHFSFWEVAAGSLSKYTSCVVVQCGGLSLLIYCVFSDIVGSTHGPYKPHDFFPCQQ